MELGLEGDGHHRPLRARLCRLDRGLQQHHSRYVVVRVVEQDAVVDVDAQLPLAVRSGRREDHVTLVPAAHQGGRHRRGERQGARERLGRLRVGAAQSVVDGGRMGAVAELGGADVPSAAQGFDARREVDRTEAPAFHGEVADQQRHRLERGIGRDGEGFGVDVGDEVLPAGPVGERQAVRAVGEQGQRLAQALGEQQRAVAPVRRVEGVGARPPDGDLLEGVRDRAPVGDQGLARSGLADQGLESRSLYLPA